jgi:hypothetical protein
LTYRESRDGYRQELLKKPEEVVQLVRKIQYIHAELSPTAANNAVTKILISVMLLGSFQDRIFYGN